MTLFSYHKYNDFILIQEIYTQKYTACTKDEANRIADNNLQSDGTSYANGLAQADRCDCPEPECTRRVSAYITETYTSPPGVKYEVQDSSSNCSGSECNSKQATVTFSCSNGDYHTQRVNLTCNGSFSSTEFFSADCPPGSITISASY